MEPGVFDIVLRYPEGMGLDNPVHILFILLILLLVFGARRLPEIGRSLGEGMRGFKDAITGAETRQSLTPAPPQAAAPAPAPVVAAPAPAPAPEPVAAAPAPGAAPVESGESQLADL